MAEPFAEQPGFKTLDGERVTAGMAQRMWMDVGNTSTIGSRLKKLSVAI